MNATKTLAAAVAGLLATAAVATAPDAGMPGWVRASILGQPGC